MRWLENITGGYSSSAKVVSGTLVLSLPDASSPVVWRMELDEIKAAAFEIKEGADGFTLIMKTPKGDAQEIAPFDNKNRAMKALMAASHAMEQAQSAIKSAANDSATTSAPQKTKSGGQLVTGIIGIIILAVLIFGITQMGPTMPPPAGSQSVATNSAASGDPAGNVGVPMSADDFLRGR